MKHTMISGDTTILDVFRDRVVRHPDRIAIEELTAGGAKRDVALSWREWHELSTRVARALLRDGVHGGDAVAIFAGNRNLWPIAELGVLMAGAIAVGVDPASSVDRVVEQLADCGAVAAIVDGNERLATIMASRGALPALQLVVCEDSASNGVRWWGEWLGDTMASDTPLPDPAPDDVALVAYAPDGPLVGARIPHRYLSASAASVRAALGLAERDSALSVLPYADMHEQVFGLCARILCGMRVGHVVAAEHLGAAASAFEPTHVVVSPRSCESIHQALVARESASGGQAAVSWRSAIELGRERSALQARGGVVPDILEARWRVAAAPCRAAVAQLVGANIRALVATDRGLDAASVEYLAAAGLPVRAVHGKVEQLCIAMQRAGGADAGTAGPPMPGAELSIGEGAELLVARNALTFAGYHGKPNATRRAFTADGRWLRTGERGEILPAGQLRVLASGDR